MSHPSDLDLDRHASGAADRAVEAHVAECDDCRDYVAHAREVDAMAHDRSWWQDVDRMLVPLRHLDTALAARTTIEAENVQTARRLAPLLKTPLRFLDADLPHDPAFRTPATVRMLCAEAFARLTQWPKFSLNLASAAREIAEQLNDPFLRAIALREEANALRYLGPFRDALAKLDQAAALFNAGDPADAPFDVAIVDYIRSAVLVQYDETTEDAVRCSRPVIATFRDYGDDTRELSARVVESIALYYLGQTAEALAAFEALIADARRLDEKLVLAYALKDAAVGYMDLGRLGEAALYQAEAVALFDELHGETEKVYIAWDLALLTVRRGELASGAMALDSCRNALLRLGLKNDHALATLDWAETRLSLGQAEGVAEACRQIMIEFEAEGMRHKAGVALDYALRALAAKQATPALIHDVRQYLTRLPRRPNISFTPAA
jgi:tetratricopeptide (TPR) repeat protein